VKKYNDSKALKVFHLVCSCILIVSNIICAIKVGEPLYFLVSIICIANAVDAVYSLFDKNDEDK
jgi:hypothetical protein